VVLVVLGVIIFAASGRLDGSPDSQIHKARTDLGVFAASLDDFHSRNHRYPDANEGLGATLAANKRPVDPWGHPYVYRNRGSDKPQMYSVGPNGVDEGGAGDDVSEPVK